MDRADYFKKKGSTVDAKFARLHRRSIDQRNIRGMSFMENRAMGSMEELAFSPVKEDDRVKTAMPPPVAAPPKARKGNGVHNKSSSDRSKPAPAPLGKTAIPPAGMTRREKLMKWKEEKEMKKKQLASKTKPQVFRVSKTVAHQDASILYPSKLKPAAVPKPISKPSPVPQRTTRSSTRRAPVKKSDPAPSTRTRRGPPPINKAAPPRMPSTRSVTSERAPSTRQSARLASKPAPIQNSRTTRGTKVQEKTAPVAKKAAQVVEKVAPLKEEEEEEVVEKPAEANVEPAEIDEATFTVTKSRPSLLTDTFGKPSGFTFRMEVPELPFTPISPASASIFLFPSTKSNTELTPSQRRCSTPYSLRPLRKLDQMQGQELIPPQPNITEEGDVAMETQPCEPVKLEESKKPGTEIQAIKENERTPLPQEEVAMETGDTVKAETVQREEITSVEPMSREPEEGKPENTATSPSPIPEKGVPYFKSLISSETTRLLERCTVWENIMSESNLSEEVCGEVRSTIGKAKLLIDQRFKQFLGLIKNCEFGLGEKVTHCSDLEGFWEMIYFQVEDVDALFKELEKSKENNWEREEKKVAKPKVIIKKKKPVSKKPVGGEAAAKRIAARERLLAAKAAMQAKATRKAESEKIVFEGGFFKVESPARKATPVKTKELREDGLSRQALQTMTNIMASPALATRSPALLKKTSAMASPAHTTRSPALLKRSSAVASPASTMCSPALQKMTIMSSPGSNHCSPALQKRSKLMDTPVTKLCSPLRRRTRKSSLGLGLSQAPSLFTPEKDSPVKEAVVQDLISWD